MNRNLRITCVVAALLLALPGIAAAQNVYKGTWGGTARSFDGLLVAPRAMDVFRSLFYLEARAGDWQRGRRALDSSCNSYLDPYSETPPVNIEWRLNWQLLAFPCTGRASACLRPTVLRTGQLRARINTGEGMVLPSPDDELVTRVPQGCCLAMQIVGRPGAGPLAERLELSCGTAFLAPHN